MSSTVGVGANDHDDEQPLLDASRRLCSSQSVGMAITRVKTSEEESQGVLSREELRESCKDHGFRAMMVERVKAPPLLLSGAVIWILAFTGVYALEWVLVYNPFNEEYGFAYPSGYGYIASTFSDLSARSTSVQAAIFHSCGILSAISIQTSWYTELLRNVHTHQQRVRFFRVRWTLFRLIVPTMGMLLLTGVATAPVSVWMASPGKSLLTSVLVNGMGCWAVFLSYALSELHCLGYCGFLTVHEEEDEVKRGGLPVLSDAERKWRLRSVAGAIVCCLLFIVAQGALSVINTGCPGLSSGDINDLVNEHCDEWAAVGKHMGLHDNGTWLLVEHNFAGRHVEIQDRPEVINTASGVISWVKGASLTFEYIGMVLFCFNIFAIWYFCEERHFPREYLSVEDEAEPQEEACRLSVLAGNFSPDELAQLRNSARGVAS